MPPVSDLMSNQSKNLIFFFFLRKAMNSENRGNMNSYSNSIVMLWFRAFPAVLV